jgi:GTP-binding protein
VAEPLHARARFGHVGLRLPVGRAQRSARLLGVAHVLADLVDGESQYIAAKGGKGGLGNAHFATPTNRVPRYAQSGLPGDELTLRLELKMIAQVGLVGLPNAGKSTLLKALTRANPKIADYPFTTLFPNLGVLRADNREIVIADIPGLIEGAAEGHGLGSDFLRHIERTQILLHLVALNLDGPEATFNDYCVVRNELKNAPHQLDLKPTSIVLTKSDLMTDEDIAEHGSFFTENGVSTMVISAIANQGIDELSRKLLREVEI